MSATRTRSCNLIKTYLIRFAMCFAITLIVREKHIYVTLTLCSINYPWGQNLSTFNLYGYQSCYGARLLTTLSYYCLFDKHTYDSEKSSGNGTNKGKSILLIANCYESLVEKGKNVCLKLDKMNNCYRIWIFLWIKTSEQYCIFKLQWLWIY